MVSPNVINDSLSATRSSASSNEHNNKSMSTSQSSTSTITSTVMLCNRKQQTPQPLKMRRVASFTVPPPLASSSQQQQNNTGQQRKRYRLVRFNSENICQVVGEVPSRSDLGEEDFQNILWYTKDEFKAMKKDFIPIIKKLVKKLPLDDDEEEARGLEHKTPKGSKLRQQNRYQAMDAVLSEQERQWERGRSDDDYIAQIYRQSSAHCQMNAYLIGQRDAEAAAAAVAMGEDEVVVEQVQKEETDTEDNNETTRISSMPQDIELFEGKDSFDVDKRGSVSPTTVVVVVVDG
jgi:hypothetical protein